MGRALLRHRGDRGAHAARAGLVAQPRLRRVCLERAGVGCARAVGRKKARPPRRPRGTRRRRHCGCTRLHDPGARTVVRRASGGVVAQRCRDGVRALRHMLRRRGSGRSRRLPAGAHGRDLDRRLREYGVVAALASSAACDRLAGSLRGVLGGLARVRAALSRYATGFPSQHRWPSCAAGGRACPVACEPCHGRPSARAGMGLRRRRIDWRGDQRASRRYLASARAAGRSSAVVGLIDRRTASARTRNRAAVRGATHANADRVVHLRRSFRGDWSAARGQRSAFLRVRLRAALRRGQWRSDHCQGHAAGGDVRDSRDRSAARHVRRTIALRARAGTARLCHARELGRDVRGAERDGHGSARSARRLRVRDRSARRQDLRHNIRRERPPQGALAAVRSAYGPTQASPTVSVLVSVHRTNTSPAQLPCTGTVSAGEQTAT